MNTSPLRPRGDRAEPARDFLLATGRCTRVRVRLRVRVLCNLLTTGRCTRVRAMVCLGFG